MPEQDNVLEQGNALEQPELITIAVVGPHSAEIKFRIRRTTKMEKVMDAYFNRVGVRADESEDLRFFANGVRVGKENTAQDLDLKEGDALEIYARQEGGANPIDSEHMVIKVMDQNTEIRFQLRPTTKFLKVKKAFSERIGLPLSYLRFTLNGLRIRDEDTPLGLDMTEEDSIDVFIQQQGGSL